MNALITVKDNGGNVLGEQNSVNVKDLGEP